MQDLILRTQSETSALKQRAVKLARMWEERKHGTTRPRADRALVLMEVARDAALAAGVIQEIKMALDAKEFIDLLVKFRFIETVDDEGAARDFLSRQPKEKIEAGAARFFNVFNAEVGRYGGIFLDRSGRPLLVEGPRLVEFVKWFVEQLLLEKEAEKDRPIDKLAGTDKALIDAAYKAHEARMDKAHALSVIAQMTEASRVPPSLIEQIKNVNIMTGELGPDGSLILPPHEGEALAIVGPNADDEMTPGGIYRKLTPAYDAELARLDKERRARPDIVGPELDTKEPVTLSIGEKTEGYSRPVTGTYVGADVALKGETAIIRVGSKGVLAQFDNMESPLAYGWHAYGLGDFEIDPVAGDEE